MPDNDWPDETPQERAYKLLVAAQNDLRLSRGEQPGAFAWTGLTKLELAMTLLNVAPAEEFVSAPRKGWHYVSPLPVAPPNSQSAPSSSNSRTSAAPLNEETP